jgi:hypothetical protein
MCQGNSNTSSDYRDDDSCADQPVDHARVWDAHRSSNESLLPCSADTRCQLSLKSQVEQPDPAIQAGEQAAEDSARDAAPIPFVIQFERKLFLVTWELTRWTLAELEFDAASCTFVEQRRTFYEWPREAFGVLLSRFALLDRVDPSLLQRTSEDFARWLGSQFQIYARKP